MTDDEKLKFRQDVKNLYNTKPQMVDDFQKPVVKDLPVEKINTREALPIKSGADFQADKILRDARKQAISQAASPDVLDYKVLRKQFADKARDAAKSGIGRKVLGLAGAIPGLGALGTFAATGDASAAAEELPGDIPVVGSVYEAIRPEPSGPAAGSMDERIENGTLTDDDKMSLRKRALQGL